MTERRFDAAERRIARLERAHGLERTYRLDRIYRRDQASRRDRANRVDRVARVEHRDSRGAVREATGHDESAEVHETADVIVVGARCAGAATAMLLAASGHDVLVVDRSTFPSDTLSTHAIARAGVVQLHRWGLLDRVIESGAPPIRQVAFHMPDDTIRRTVKDRSGVDLVLAPRRTELDAILLDAARDAGARVLTGVTVEGVRRADDGRVAGVYGRDEAGRVELASRFVVGADGLRSRIARAVGAEVTESRPSPGAGHYAHVAGDWEAAEYYIGDRALAGIFPTHDGEACIWVCNDASDAERYRRDHPTIDAAFDAMLHDAAPELAARVAAGTSRSVVRGTMRLPNQLRHPVGAGWALVGDAGYHRDAVTGFGISDAFRDAELLADSLDAALTDTIDEATALRGYHTRRDAMLREIFEITCELSQFPPADRFAELQKALGRAIDAQAAELAARPAPHVGAAV